MKQPNCLALAFGILLLAGCTTNTLVFSTATRTGIEITAADGAQQGAQVGFDRFEGIVMPTVIKKNGADVFLTDVYPAYAEYELRTGGLTMEGATGDSRGLVLRQAFATGRAATNPAVQTKVVDEFERLGGGLIDSKALEDGTKLLRLHDQLKPDSLLSKDLISAVEKHLRNDLNGHYSVRELIQFAPTANKPGLKRVMSEIEF